MAKRELSNTLKNLKFMQRGAQKDEKPKEEETKTPLPQEDFNFPSNVTSKCGSFLRGFIPAANCDKAFGFGSLSCVNNGSVVVMEGDPHPGIINGRMSFQNFNPVVDKLNDDVNGHEAEVSTSSSFQNGKSVDRKNGPTEDTEMNTGYSDGERKRKQQAEEPQTTHPKKQKKKSRANNQVSASESRSSQKQSKNNKNNKLDWNVLVPPKSQRKGGKEAQVLRDHWKKTEPHFIQLKELGCLLRDYQRLVNRRYHDSIAAGSGSMHLASISLGKFSYGFYHVKDASQLRMDDIPKLLTEYKQLVAIS